jgi:transcriptional regulator with XRE-family HTH domain
MSDTTYPNSAWVRLGRAVKRRRLGLGLSQAEVNAAGGPSVGVISKLENAKQDFYEDRVYADLEKSLGWQAGSVDAILAGGDPTIATPPGHLPAITAESSGLVKPRRDEGDSDVTHYLHGLLQSVDQRLAEMNQQLAEQSQQLAEQNRRIEELQRDQRRDDSDKHQKSA